MAYGKTDTSSWRGVYSPQEVERSREGVEASRGASGELLGRPRLRDVILDGRLVEIARQILGQEEIVYAGDSSFTVGMRQRGWHKDNSDRKDPNGADWQGRYTILRFGIYLQDHRKHTGGLNLRVGSHTTTDQPAGKSIYVRTGVGDVGVWSLRITHSGNGTLLRFPWWEYPAPTSTSTSCCPCSPAPSAHRSATGSAPATPTPPPTPSNAASSHTGGTIHNNGDTITIRLDRRTYSPVLRSAHIPDTDVPWWGGRTLHFDYT